MSLKNVIKNTFSVYDIFSNPSNIPGLTEIILLETITSVIFFSLFSPKHYPGLNKLFLTHFLSIPFLNGIPTDFRSKNILSVYADKSKKSFVQAIKQSSRGIPGVLVAQYISNTYTSQANMFRLPQINFVQLLVIAGSKFITRPLFTTLSSVLGINFSKEIDMLQTHMLSKQYKNSKVKDVLEKIFNKKPTSTGEFLIGLARDLP